MQMTKSIGSKFPSLPLPAKPILSGLLSSSSSGGTVTQTPTGTRSLSSRWNLEYGIVTMNWSSRPNSNLDPKLDSNPNLDSKLDSNSKFNVAMNSFFSCRDELLLLLLFFFLAAIRCSASFPAIDAIDCYLESEINNQPLDRGRDRYSCCLLNISAEYFNGDSFVDRILLAKFLFDFFVKISYLLRVQFTLDFFVLDSFVPVLFG